jgi:hypothetical protein
MRFAAGRPAGKDDLPGDSLQKLNVFTADRNTLKGRGSKLTTGSAQNATF